MLKVEYALTDLETELSADPADEPLRKEASRIINAYQTRRHAVQALMAVATAQMVSAMRPNGQAHPPPGQRGFSAKETLE